MMTQEQLAEMEAADAALPKSLHNYNRAFADRRALLSHARASVERIEAKDKVLLQVWEAINSNGAQRPWTGTKREEWKPDYHFEVTLSAKDYFDIKAALERTPR